MRAGQTSWHEGVQNFLCPFTDMYITQGSGGSYSHKGIMANDVRGLEAGVRYPYYAPCDIKCVKVYAPSGESRWQSLNPVRFANGRIDYATFEICHDDTQDCYVGQIISQGMQLGNMGTKGNATGVHCHIQISQSNDTTFYKNEYGILKFNNEYDTDDCYFVDGTNIMNCFTANWRTTDILKPKEETKIEEPIIEITVAPTEPPIEIETEEPTLTPIENSVDKIGGTDMNSKEDIEKDPEQCDTHEYESWIKTIIEIIIGIFNKIFNRKGDK